MSGPRTSGAGRPYAIMRDGTNASVWHMLPRAIILWRSEGG